MRYVVIFCALLALGCSTTQKEENVWCPDFIINNALPSLVQVDFDEGLGSAVCIKSIYDQGEYTYIFASVAHVMSMSGEMQLRGYEYDWRGRRKRAFTVDYVDSSIVYDENVDVAIFSITTAKYYPVVPVDILSEKDSFDLIVGQEVWMIGCPLGATPFFSKGFIVQLGVDKTHHSDFPHKVDIFSMDADRGVSGGGIFDSQGYLIGINSLVFTNDSHACVLGAVNVQALYNLLKEERGYFYNIFKHKMIIEENNGE